MNTRAVRWSDNDRYFGPFIYARADSSYHPFTVALSSFDDDEEPSATLRISAFGHTLITVLPPIIKPYRKWVESHDYWDVYRTEYGFTIVEGAIHLRYGAQTHDSSTDKSKCWFLPWQSWRMVRHSLYDYYGAHYWTAPRDVKGMEGFEELMQTREMCPKAYFLFKDFDGEEIAATTHIEEREWRLGEGKFKWLSLFRRSKVSRSLDIRFSKETGKRKGSWKGGTVGHSIEMLPGERHGDAFKRYCQEHEMTFVD